MRDADLENGLTWAAAPLNNTYRFAVRSEAVVSGRHHHFLGRGRAARERAHVLRGGGVHSPRTGDPMLEAYGLALRRGGRGAGPEHRGLRHRRLLHRHGRGDCNFGQASPRTDASTPWTSRCWRTTAGFFPANAAPAFNTETLEKYPELEARFAQALPCCSRTRRRELNARVDQGGEEPGTWPTTGWWSRGSSPRRPDPPGGSRRRRAGPSSPRGPAHRTAGASCPLPRSACGTPHPDDQPACPG
ncbi:hypothetical protein QJS66_10880 [Kocuria rhizophila]|nr:hypothetical protein QJS66_10880 [Kocuria rhizophila]